MTENQAIILPDLDSACGRNFTYRKFIECGETQTRTGIPNLPTNPLTYASMLGLATNILDPIVAQFGAVELTYGFCSYELGRKITARVSHPNDQHASEDRKPNGEMICSRGGAACDFWVVGHDMREVAHWIVKNLPFDRLYFYESDRPVHVSWSTVPASKSYEMRLTESGKRMPRPFK